MAARQLSLLASGRLKSCQLFALIVVPMCVAVFVVMTTVDLATPLGVSAMITFSVRLAVPWLFLAFAASSLLVVFPSTLSSWL